MSEPAQTCENNTIFNQNYAQKLFIAFKMAYSCSFGWRGNLDSPDFLQKKFYNIDYRQWNISDLLKMHYSTNLMTYNETKRNTIQDYSAEIIPLREESLIFVWLDIANYSRQGVL